MGEPEDITHLFVFIVEGQRYALRLAEIDRVLRAVEVRPIPNAPPHVLGVVNVHGVIVPVVSVRTRLGLPDREMELGDRLVVVAQGERRMALLVDAVVGVDDSRVSDAVPVDSVLPGAECSVGMVKTDSGIMLVCDPGALLPGAAHEALSKADWRGSNEESSCVA